MQTFEKFTVEILDESAHEPEELGQCHTVCFNLGDTALLNSTFDNTEDIWIGSIVEIRARPDHETWVKVQWYWSRNDVAGLIKSFDPLQCAPYERLSSDSCDILSPYCFSRVVWIPPYEECALDPPDLGPEDPFYRAYLKHRQRAIVPVLGSETCLCSKTYNPFPPEFSSDDVMHFCPHPECRKCQPGLTSPPRHTGVVLRGSRHPDDATIVSEISPSSTAAPLALDAALASMSVDPSKLAHLPPALLNIAQCPIIRCAGYVEGGWAVGNVRDVVLARRFVYSALEGAGCGEMAHQLEQLVRKAEAYYEQAEPDGDIEMMEYDQETSETMLQDISEGLEEYSLSLSLVASPYPRYWERRLGEFTAVSEFFDDLPFVCPGCQNPI
ncbi:hypothetical protein A0H81_03060 [Grifola frondosa]|uniref:BAH domain-containing protein n=1 Tax=Grifola frondosa TaxID=5627 RepID=A0A1C7MHF8_GRIFR|nr:hypothetical protein A0H81_03060 [Grifola frondosa]